VNSLVPPVQVVCGVLRGDCGRFLVARRPEGACHAGLWEFAGGKIHPGESPEQALIREWNEELGVEIAIEAALPPVPSSTSTGAPILLLPFQIRLVRGSPTALEHSELLWAYPGEIEKLPLAPGDTLIAASAREILK